MSGGFANPIIGGGGGLVYPSIHSPNFVTHVSGWTINKDGSAEFNNLTIRGTFLGTEFVFDSTGFYFYIGVPAFGNAPVFYVTSAAVDPFGNPVVQTVGINGGTGLFNFLNPSDNTTRMTVADGLIQKLFTSALASEIDLDRNNPAVVNQIRMSALGQGGLNDAMVRLQAQITAGVPAQLYVNQETIVNATDPQDILDRSPESWHDLRPLQNSFVGTIANEFPPQFRMCADGDVELFGTVQLPGAGAYNGIQWQVLPTQYRPSKFVSIPVVVLGGTMSGDTTAGSPRLFTDSTGTLQFNGIQAAINGSNIRFSGKFPKNNNPITV